MPCRHPQNRLGLSIRRCVCACLSAGRNYLSLYIVRWSSIGRKTSRYAHYPMYVLLVPTTLVHTRVYRPSQRLLLASAFLLLLTSLLSRRRCGGSSHLPRRCQTTRHSTRGASHFRPARSRLTHFVTRVASHTKWCLPWHMAAV